MSALNMYCGGDPWDSSDVDDNIILNSPVIIMLLGGGLLLRGIEVQSNLLIWKGAILRS